MDVRLSTSAALSGLNPGQTYYFAVTAYDTTGNESAYSSGVAYTVPSSSSVTPTVTAQSVPDGATDVRTDVTLSIPFNEALDHTTITTTTV